MQVLNERRQAISVLKRRGVWTIDSPPSALSSDLINHYLMPGRAKVRFSYFALKVFHRW